MFPWALFFILVAMGVFGAVAIIPYAFTLHRSKLENVPMSRGRLIAMTVVQSTILVSIVTVLGLLAAKAVGLGVPIIESALAGEFTMSSMADTFPIAIFGGAVAATLTLVLEFKVFMPHLPAALKEAATQTSLWKRFLAGFYGGIVEELLLRLFAVSALVWLLSRLSNGVPSDGMFWIAIVVATLLFGIGHLPATARITPLTPLIVVRGLLLNGIVGIVAGVLFWRYGLEAAMIAHFTADMVIHVLPGLFKRSRESATMTPAHNV